jgi:hypothetical protein
MSKRHFVAVYTDDGCLCSCQHKHPTVTNATACISQPGGYVVAVRRRKLFPLTEAEEEEFQRAMYGREEVSPKAEALGLALLTKLKTEGSA